MYNWKDTRNYRRFRDENGNVIANIIYVDGEEVSVSDEVYEAYNETFYPYQRESSEYQLHPGRRRLSANYSQQTSCG